MKNHRQLYLVWLNSILLFWALWYSLVSLSDLTNFLIYFHFMPAIAFNSKNYELVLASFNVYQIHSGALTIIAFLIVVIWNFLTAFMTYFALFKRNNQFYFSLIAFALSMLQDVGFILLNEVFIQYTAEHGHMARLSFKVVTLILFLIMTYAANKPEKCLV